MEVTSRRIEVEMGVSLYVAEVGSGECVVFLHGFPDGWALWTAQMVAVAEAGLRAVAVEQRGYRLSSQPRGIRAYRVARLAEDVAAVIRALGYETATVVGHDWGGGVAWCFAMLFPEMVERLVVINAPHPRKFVEGLQRWRQIRRSWYVALFQLPWLAEWATGAPTGAVNWYRAMRFGGVPRARIEHPVLVIWGDDDPFLTRELAEPDARDVSNAQVVHVKAGHWVMRDAADEVSRLITGFLAKG